MVEVKLTKAMRRIVRDNPLAIRLMAKAVEEGACWLWTGASGPKGYGFIYDAGRSRKAHRVAYELFCGPIPDGLFVCHHCDRPACINPRHLFLGRAADNMRDMVRKGRGKNTITSAQSHFKAGHSPRGEGGGGAKLSEAQATEIARRHLAGERTKALAAEYGVDRTTIQRLMRGRNWRHIAGRAALTQPEAPRE